MSNSGYAIATPRLSSAKQRRKVVDKTKMTNMTFRKRLRNWLFEEKESDNDYIDHGISIEEDRFNSDGMRLQIYKGSGGFVVETRGYDRKRDENKTNMYIITDEKDLGEELGKIITMESMR